MRSTSLAAYAEIQSSGALSKMRWRVYDALFTSGPLTAHELDDLLRTPSESKTSYHKRLTELERQGVAQRVGERACRITGMRAELWDVTDKLPIKYVAPVTENDRLREALKRYGRHDEGCAVRWQRLGGRCGCGFDDVLEDSEW